MATETLRPNGNSQTQLMNSSGGYTNNYTYVDESVTNDSDYVHSATSAAWVTDLYALPDTAIPAGSTINSITFYARFCEWGGGNDYAKFAYKSGGTVYYSSAPNITTSFATYSWVQNTNQKTSAAWTIDDINALTAGISLYWAGGKSSAVGRCSQFWLVIDYTPPPTDVTASENDSSKVVVTWTKSTGATGYKVYRDDELIDTVGDVATYNDTGADAPVITAGSTVASDGTSSAHVALRLSGTSIANGTSYTYKVKAINDVGESDFSSTDTGYRKAGTLGYQWQRSAADSDDDYSDIDGATTASYNDTGAPEDGSGRYYKCVISATGSSNQTSSADRGYRVIKYTMSLSDTVVISGNISLNSAFIRLFTDTAILFDSLSKQLYIYFTSTVIILGTIFKSFNRTFTEAIETSEFYLKSFGKNISDTITTSEVFSRVSSFVRSIADTAVISDAFSRAASFIRSITDTAAISDTFSRASSYVRSIVDSVNISDSFSRVTSFVRSISDTTVISDAFSKVSSFIRTKSDTTVISDSFSRAIAFIRLKVDTVLTSFVSEVSGSVSRANIKISAIDGTAFVDFSTADVLTNYLGGKLTITDSAGKKLIGYIKAAGTGETLGSEKIGGSWTNGGTVYYPYNTLTTSGADVTSAVNSYGAQVQLGLENATYSLHALYKVLVTLTLNSGEKPRFGIGGKNSFGMAAGQSFFANNGANTAYITTKTSPALGAHGFYNTNLTNWSATGISFKQVLTPSATGVTIVSEKGGATYNWASKDAAFNYNDASGYTYTIESWNEILKALYRTILGNVTISDTFSRLSNFVRTITDTVVTSDSRVASFFRTISDTTIISDVFAKVSSYLRSIISSVKISDSRVVSFARIITETIKVSDTFSRLSNFVRTITDTVLSSEARSARLERILTDIAKISDSFIKSFGKAITSIINISETIIKSFGKNISSVVEISESYLKTFGKGVTDIVKISLTAGYVFIVHPVYEFLHTRWRDRFRKNPVSKGKDIE